MRQKGKLSAISFSVAEEHKTRGHDGGIKEGRSCRREETEWVYCWMGMESGELLETETEAEENVDGDGAMSR